MFDEPPYAEPHVRWCERATGATPSPTRYGGIDDDPFKLCRAYGCGLHGGVDGGLEQFLYPGFADGGAKAANLGGIAGQCRRVLVLATEVVGPAKFI